jgi:hypothetical protein
MVLTNKAGQQLSWINKKLETTEKSAEIYRSLISSFHEFVSAKDLERVTLEIGGQIIAINSIQKSYAGSFCSSLKHLKVECNHEDIAIFLILRRDLPAHLNPPRFPYGHFEDKNLRFSYNAFNGSIEVLDKLGSALYLIGLEFDEFLWTLSSFTLHYLKQVLNLLGFVNMHGAVIGKAGQGIFLANRGGSGKSSLMAYSVCKGMQTLGDDFLTMRMTQPTVFYSLFTQFKLAESSPSIQIVKENFHSIGIHDGKEVFDIINSRESQFQSEMNIREILIPFIGSKIQIHDIDTPDAYKRILPSTVVLNHAVKETIEATKVLLETLPVHYLELTEDLASAHLFLEERLSI